MTPDKFCESGFVTKLHTLLSSLVRVESILRVAFFVVQFDESARCEVLAIPPITPNSVPIQATCPRQLAQSPVQAGGFEYVARHLAVVSPAAEGVRDLNDPVHIKPLRKSYV